MQLELDGMSVKELSQFVAEAQQKIEAKKEEELASLRSEVTQLIEDRGYTVEEIFPNGGIPKKKNKVAPVYRDPENLENTWTGRGRKPKWLAEAIEAGADIESFRIVDS